MCLLLILLSILQVGFHIRALQTWSWFFISLIKHINSMPEKVFSVVTQGRQHGFFNNSHWYLIISWVLLGLKICHSFITTLSIYMTLFRENIHICHYFREIPLFLEREALWVSMCLTQAMFWTTVELVSHRGTLTYIKMV